MFRRSRIDDAAIGDLLTGNGAGDETLAAFVEELRCVSRGPVPVPSTQLAALLANGFSPVVGAASAAPAGDVFVPAVRSALQAPWAHPWAHPRRVVLVALGVGVASLMAAGAAGALPAGAQHAMSTAVEAVTPFSFPDRANDSADFGRRVSTDARDGGVDGQTVSDDAAHNGDTDHAEHNGDTHHTDGSDDAPGARNGQVGIDTANGTPAAGHVPTSVPAGPPETIGSGLDTAGATPAAGRLPESVPDRPTNEASPLGAATAGPVGITTPTTSASDPRIPSAVPAPRP